MCILWTIKVKVVAGRPCAVGSFMFFYARRQSPGVQQKALLPKASHVTGILVSDGSLSERGTLNENLKCTSLGWVWRAWHTPIISALRQLRQDDFEFQFKDYVEYSETLLQYKQKMECWGCGLMVEWVWPDSGVFASLRPLV